MSLSETYIKSVVIFLHGAWIFVEGIENVIYPINAHKSILSIPQTQCPTRRWSLIEWFSIEALLTLRPMRNQKRKSIQQETERIRRRVGSTKSKRWNLKRPVMKCSFRNKLAMAKNRAENVFPLKHNMMKALLQTSSRWKNQTLLCWTEQGWEWTGWGIVKRISILCFTVNIF